MKTNRKPFFVLHVGRQILNLVGTGVILLLAAAGALLAQSPEGGHVWLSGADTWGGPRRGQRW